MTKDWNKILQEANDNYDIIVDEASATITYVGEAVIGNGTVATSDAKWRIKRIAVSGSVTTVRWAENTDTFSLIWDNRASYTY